MAKTLSVPTTRFEGVRVKPSDLLIDWSKNKSRAFPYTPDDVQDILDDFREGRGIINPLTVGKSEDGKPELEAGFRRAYAALLWEQGTPATLDHELVEPHPDFKVPVLFEEAKTSLDRLVLNARENIARKNLTAIDLGGLAVAFEEEGLSNVDTAKKLGVSEAQITQHKKLVRELPEFVQMLVAKGTLTKDDAFTLLKVQPEDRLQVLNEYLEGKATKILADAKAVPAPPIQPQVKVTKLDPVPDESPEPPVRSKTLRDVATDHGANVGSMRMPELKKYLEEAIESDGPGSNKGEVALKREILLFLDRKITNRQMDNRFDKLCKEK